MATIKDVARLAGVAVSTASYALNNSTKVSPKTAKKVSEAAKRLNYRKNGIARDLKMSKTGNIGLILSDLSGPFYSELIRGVQETSLSYQYGLIACSSMGGQNSTSIKFIQESRVDGVIVLAPNIEDSVLLEQARDNFPIVVLDRPLEGKHLINISSDNVNGGFVATTHLLQLGHREIAFFGGPSDSRDSQCRFQGYLKALESFDISFQPKWKLEGKFTQAGGYHSAKMMMLQGELPTALFCANDEMAVGASEAFRESGVRVPEDISVVGFDDIAISKYHQPSLTTVKQSKYEMGSLAAHLLHQALHGDFPEKDFVLPVELVARKSTVSYRPRH